MPRKPALITIANRRRALLQTLKLQAEARARVLTPAPTPAPKCQEAPADPAPPAQAEPESPATESGAWSEEMRIVLEMKRLEREEHAKVLRECHRRIEELRRQAQEDSQYDFLKMFRLR